MTDTLLTELQARFRETTRVRLQDMALQLDAVDRDPGDTAAIASLNRAFHAMAGLGGTYGFPGVSRLGDEAEASILPIMRRGSAVPKELVQRWRGILDAIALELATPAAPAEPLPEAEPAFVALLVEPDAELVNALARALEQEGVTVRRCATHEAALAELDFHAPDVLIVNLQLPDGSGIDVLERLRKLERGDAAGSIAINDAGDFNAKVRAIRSGANAFFAKPLDLPSLVRRVIAFRARRRRAPARVLAVEDDPTQSLILRSVLGKAGYEIAVCSDPAQFENLLASFLPDLLLMDIHLDRGVGDISGFDLVRLLRQNDQFAHLPVIFVSGDRERDALMESAMSGGDTLVSKPVDWGVLLSQIASRLERASAVREVTDRDGLSGVLTRAAFHARVRERLSLQAEDARSIVVIIDLDHFKSVNDTHGHLAGDRVLASIGSCLRRGVRQADLVGRYGGEEFVLLLEEIALDDAVRLVERLLEDFSQIDQGGWRVTFSAGVATFDQSLEETLRRADAALYEAKRAGRARVVAA